MIFSAIVKDEDEHVVQYYVRRTDFLLFRYLCRSNLKAMCEKYNFDDIRPYHDSEVNHHLNILLNNSGFQWILDFIFKDEKKIQEAIAFRYSYNQRFTGQFHVFAD